jgi:hypothetical protein
MRSPRRLLGYTLFSCLLAFAALLAACSSLANPSAQVLLVESEAGSIGVNPGSVKVFGDSISAEIHFNYKQPTPEGLTNCVWNATFTVPKRLLHVETVTDYDSRRNYRHQAHELTGYYYVEPGLPLDGVMKSLISYCQSRGRAIDTEPLSFFKQGFQYMYRTDDVMHFFDPASVKLADGTLQFTMLDFHYLGDFYNTNSVIVDTSQHRLRILPGKRYEGTGRMIGLADGSQWMDYTPQSIFRKSVDKILQSFHRDQNNRVAK